MKTPHKHAELIKAWADGFEIQFKRPEEKEWQDARHNPSWYNCFEYRIKPEPKHDKVYYGAFDIEDVRIGKRIIDSCFTSLEESADHIKITFDGETGKLKSAEVL